MRDRTQAPVAPDRESVAPRGPDGPTGLPNRALARALGTDHGEEGRLAAVSRALAGPSIPFPHAALLSPRLGTDVSAFRAHAGAPADLAQADAGAVAAGGDAAFGPAPTVREAAHEAVHLLQAGGSAEPVRLTAPHDTAETEAHDAADRVAAGATLAPGTLTRRLAPGTVGRIPPRVDTPAWPPTPAPPDTAPTGPRYDDEGNEVVEVAGRWILAEGVHPALDFPIASGYNPRLLPPNPNASYRTLHANVEAVRDAQLETANALRGDPKYWFAKVYYFVTLYELRAIDAGTYQYPHMKMQEVEMFNATYQANLAAWVAGDLTNVESNWRVAFAAAEDSDNGVQQFLSSSLEIKNALLPSMAAHIRFDLPRAIAAAYTMHYAGIPGTSLADFRPDFFAMGPVFDEANAALAPEIDEEGTDWNPTNWGWAGDAVFPFVFHVGLEREQAWEKAADIQAATGLTPDEMQRRLEGHMGTAHPNSGDEAFDVDDETVTDYDWFAQPGTGTDTQPPPANAPAPPPPPEFPLQLMFRFDRPDGEMDLADAVRPDQDLRPLLALAEWTRQVRGAILLIEGHASKEGPEYLNHNLASARGGLVKYFLFRASADLDANPVVEIPTGETGSEATAEFRYARITVTGLPVSKQQVWTPASSPPYSPPVPAPVRP